MRLCLLYKHLGPQPFHLNTHTGKRQIESINSHSSKRIK